MKVKIINKSKNSLPEYSTVLSAGMDLRANIEDDIII
jgi:dUTP pyrophosphatase